MDSWISGHVQHIHLVEFVRMLFYQPCAHGEYKLAVFCILTQSTHYTLSSLKNLTYNPNLASSLVKIILVDVNGFYSQQSWLILKAEML